MISIITGNINIGKTTKLLEIYEETKCGDGFILPKVYKGDNNIGQQIVRLSNHSGIPFSRKEGYIPSNWHEKYRYNVYSFSKEGFDFANTVIEDVLANNKSPIYIDEIGPLELQEKGFYKLLSKVLWNNQSLYLVVRNTLMKAVLMKFNISEFKVIEIQEKHTPPYSTLLNL